MPTDIVMGSDAPALVLDLEDLHLPARAFSARSKTVPCEAEP